MIKSLNKSTRAYSIIELLIFGVAILGIFVMAWPSIQTLRGNEKAALKGKIISKVEAAKNQFDTEADTEDRKRFDTATNEDRYSILSSLLGERDAIRFLAGSGIKTLKINKLGDDVETSD